tara:strand:- start:16315 stop:16539 length:225 start_codon:yes stop_codon:yes gene_type:complete
MDRYKFIETALGVVAGGIVFGVWVYITVDLFGIVFASDGLSGFEWVLFGLGYAVFTVVLLLAGVYAVDATREDV